MHPGAIVHFFGTFYRNYIIIFLEIAHAYPDFISKDTDFCRLAALLICQQKRQFLTIPAVRFDVARSRRDQQSSLRAGMISVSFRSLFERSNLL